MCGQELGVGIGEGVCGEGGEEGEAGKGGHQQVTVCDVSRSAGWPLVDKRQLHTVPGADHSVLPVTRHTLQQGTPVIGSKPPNSNPPPPTSSSPPPHLPSPPKHSSRV